MEDERESASKMLRSEFNEGFASDETFDLAPYLPSYYENLYANAGVYTLSYPLELKNNHDTLVSLLGKMNMLWLDTMKFIIPNAYYLLKQRI